MLTRYVTRQFSTAAKKRIGFIGLGNMGFPMVQNLIKHGHDLTVFDIVEEKMIKAEQEGAKVAPDVAELSKNQDVCITILPTSEVVRDIRMGDNGIYKHAREGCLVIDSSTIAPDATREMTEEGEKLGLRIADVPVSGGYMGAKNGTLTCMIGCKKEDYKEVEAIYKCMGTNLFYCGEPGAGQSAKICNNLGLGIQMISVCEALALAQKLGVDQSVVAKIMSLSTGSCWSVKTYCPIPGFDPHLPASHDYDHGFESRLMKKDVGLALKEASRVNIDLQFGKKAMKYWQDIEDRGWAKKDIGIMLQHIAELKEKDE